ncbi:MAG: HAD hydrolase family protein [Phycisphaerales bacterium]|nr:HAD hydrolase family protein [Phycisphaerales bacterium]
MAHTAINLLVLDVDGVLTDGSILMTETGEQIRAFHITDGLGIAMWRALGRQVAILTSKRSPGIEARAAMLGIEMIEQGAEDKLPGLERILHTAGIPADQAAYVGDDLLDLVAMRRVGFPIAVANAAPEVKAVARFVTTRSGGHGAVREAVEHIVKRDEQWAAALRAIGADR